jgi:hypothetical protein
MCYMEPNRKESGVWGGVKLGFGGCVVLPAILLALVLGAVACVVIFLAAASYLL